MACDVFLDCVYCVYLVGVLVVCVVCLWCVWLLWWASVVCMCESVVFVCTWCVFVWCVFGGGIENPENGLRVGVGDFPV